MSGRCSKCKRECTNRESKNELFGFPCDLCKKVYCKECAGLSSTDVRALIQVTKRLPFFCEECMDMLRETTLFKISQLKKMDADVKELKQLDIKEMPKIKSNISKLQMELNECMKRCDDFLELKTDIGKLKENVTQYRTTVLQLQAEVKESNAKNMQAKQSYADILKVNILESEISDFKVQLANLNNPLEKIKPNNNTESVEEMAAEMNDREKRKKNVLMFGIAEPINKDKEERRSADKVAVNEELEKIIPKENMRNIQLYRLGKYNEGRCRPIKVIFEKNDDALSAIKNKSNLKEQIYIKRDQTKLQREYLKEVLEELEKRENNGEKNLIIKYINYVPKIVKTRDNSKN